METNRQKPDNFLAWSILTTVFCCMPLGIVAIVFSSKVDSAWIAGNYDEAENVAKQARTWTFISFGVGIFMYILCGFIGCLGAVLGS